MARKVLYIKIARIDQNGDDLTNVLESLSQITIPLTTAGNKVYKILSRADFNTYYLFQVDLDNSPDAGTVPSTTETTLNYAFTGSLGNNATGSGFIIGQVPIVSAEGGQVTTDFYNSEQQRVEINTMPKKDIHVNIGTTAAGSPFSVQINGNSGFADTGSVELFKVDQAFTNFTQLTSNPEITKGMGPTLISRGVSLPKSSITPGDIIFLGVKETGSSGQSLRGAAINITADGGGKFVGKLFLTSSANQGSTLFNIAEPFFTKRFINSDCEVLINNADSYRFNPFLQDIDFGNGLIPINNASIVAGTAQRGTVPESYYTSKNQIDPRYNGVKVQSSDFNIFTPNAGTSSFGEPINIGNYGQTPSVDVNDVNIYEFDWGGGTTPEILGYGAVKMGRILQVSSPNLVKTIDPSQGVSTNILATFAGTSAITVRDYRQNVEENLKATNTMSVDVGGTDYYFWLTTQSISDYSQILNGNNPVNSEISMFMYPNSTAGSNPTLPSTTKILNTEWVVPTRSSYALTSSNSSVYGTVGNIGSDDNLINLSNQVKISKVSTDSNGFYSGGQPIKPNWQTIGDQIVADLQEGEKWFVTLYNEFEFPNGQGDYDSALGTGSLSPYNDGYNIQDPNGDYSNPLAYKGVHEILGTFDDFSGQQFFILLKNPIIPSLPTTISTFPTSPSGSFNVNNANAAATYSVTGNVEGRPGPTVTANITLNSDTSFDQVSFTTQQGDFFNGDVIVFPTTEFNSGVGGGIPIKFVITITSSPKNIGGGAPGNSLGMLIWKARGVGKNEFVMVQDSVTGGVSAGAFISKYAPDYITENFESITKEYGANTS